MNEESPSNPKSSPKGKRQDASGGASKSNKCNNSGENEWPLDSPPPAGYEVAVDPGLGGSVAHRFKYRRSEEVCESCEGPLYEACVDGEWHESGPLCTRCLERIEADKWLDEAKEELAARSVLNRQARFENFVVTMPHQDTGLRAAQSFAEKAKLGHPLALVLYSYPQDSYSGYGVGKTHLASAAAFELQQRGWDAQTWLAPDLFSKLRASYSNESEIQEYAILNPAKTADLLVLDDVGKENAREEWRQDLYFQIVDARYRNGPIIITTNLHAVEEFPQHIGEAAYSRLWEMSRTRWWVDMSGPDWRARIAKGETDDRAKETP